MKKHYCLLMGLLTACATTAVHQSSDGIPSQILEAVCSSLLSEGELTRYDRILVEAETQPVSSMLALHFASTDKEITPDQGTEDLRWDETYKLNFEPEPINVPTTENCGWQRTDLFDGDVSKELLVELSGITENPYSGHRGVFVRYSYGGRRGASWYWLIVKQNQRGEWRAGELLALEDYDN